MFLIVNNQENIEGARQILRSIQKVERLPGQKPIGVTFALNRIPFPEEEKDKVLEEQIVKYVQNFLNEPVEDLESQLNVQDICILHSDRELELLESLRLSQEGVTQETPLLRDYLRLFSKIIPEEVIRPKLDDVLEEIVTNANLFEYPDKTQQELEGLVASYLHPRTLEKLIEFYILRKEGREKILNTFHELWRTFGIDNSKILSKYVSLFMKWDLSSWKEPNFELAIIEKYLELSPQDRIAVERRLAEAYEKYDRPEMASKHYLQLLDEVKEKDEILGEVLDIYIEKELYDDAMALFEKYSGIIDTDVSLRVKKVEVMFKVGKVEEVQKLLDDGGITESALSKREPFLYISVMERLGKLEDAEKKINTMLNDALMERDPERLYEVGRIFYRMGRADEFKNKISGKHPYVAKILSELDFNRDRRRYLL